MSIRSWLRHPSLSSRSARSLPSALGLSLCLGCPVGDDMPLDTEGGSSSSSDGSSSVNTVVDTSAGTVSTSATSSATSTTDASTTGASTTDASTTDTTTGTDTGSTTDEGSSSTGEPDTTCGAIDFLFVVDDSGSFNDEQAALVAAFPAFIAGIEASLEQVDSFHVGVVTTDDYVYNQAGCQTIGALVTSTGGEFSSNSVCGPYDAGNNFMTDLDDLPVSFSCAAQVGTSGSGIERPMDATLAAIGPALASPGACNEGFLRPDALLVIVIMTDEWDGPDDPEIPGSSGTPMDWYDAVVMAKDGVPEHVVVLSMINYAGGSCPPASAPFDGVHIADFTQMFGAQGILGGVCEPDWGPAFMDTQVAVTDACAAYGNFR